MPGRARLDVSVAHLVEHLVAEIKMQQLMVVAHGLDQPRTIGIAIDPEQHVALLARAVENFSQHRFVAIEDAALKFGLLSCEVTHSAGKTFPAISRVLATSSSSSSSGGMLSSRSIMVETRPKRFRAAA